MVKVDISELIFEWSVDISELICVLFKLILVSWYV